MESPDEEDDLKLVRASASLLSDLQDALPKLLRRPSQNGRGRVHSQAKQRDLDYVIRLIEPFQGEPQLLDTNLKVLLPAISEAYIESLGSNTDRRPTRHLDFQSAICIILYTLCKVRGYKVVLGFLNNETRYLEPILERVEEILTAGSDTETAWQVPYVLLLWLSHLVLTPFDLDSISARPVVDDELLQGLAGGTALPPIARRILLVAFKYLPASTKAQEAAAMLLVRLVERPDLQKFRLADAVVAKAQESLHDQQLNQFTAIYEKLGPLRFLAGIANSAELGHVIPAVYRTCTQISEDEVSSVASNAIGKKLIVKIFRNITVLSLRSASSQGQLLDFLESENVLEDVIDCLLRSLGDRDTPVRYAAAKALSIIIIELEPSMGHEVIQAVLDSFKEDMPQQGQTMDFRAANALKWHGLTLALAHTVFKRSASPDQLPDIVNSVVLALQFEQRTPTGSSVGTNVRDAANFGIWSLSRRYTTKELLSVRSTEIQGIDTVHQHTSVLQFLANQLLLSACLDPEGNIRRGSSAALQELIGRHPDQIYDGIALVQIVDYQAVGLRRRAMVDVANHAVRLHISYWTELLDALFDWRGLGSLDVLSREAAAASLDRLSHSEFDKSGVVLLQVRQRLPHCDAGDVEMLHGLILSLALLLRDRTTKTGSQQTMNGQRKPIDVADYRDILEIVFQSSNDFSTRMLRSDLASASFQMLAALCQSLASPTIGKGPKDDVSIDTIDLIAERLLTRREEAVWPAIPALVHSLLRLKRNIKAPLTCIGAQTLCPKVSVDASKSTLHGASRAIALGALAPVYGHGLTGDIALPSISVLGELTNAMNVDWRVIGVKALQLSVEHDVGHNVDETIAEHMVRAVHRALNDYTVDERGDVGSLVRLQGIACTSRILGSSAFRKHKQLLQILEADIFRLSLEKLDRVRLAAAQCQRLRLGFIISTPDVASVSSEKYFQQSLMALGPWFPEWRRTALLEGCISCAGISAEPLLQASRSALARQLGAEKVEHLQYLMSTFADIIKTQVADGKNAHPALELLAFLLDMQILKPLIETDFKWRNLLSTVQKAHHKSNDIPKILAAVQVYRGLVEVEAVRKEVMKKLVSMLKTNPYPRVRSSVAEQLFVITREPLLQGRDWTKPASQHSSTIKLVEERFLKI